MWGTVASIAATLIGSELTRRAQQEAIRKKKRAVEEGFRRRTKKANERLSPLFKQVAEDVAPEKEKELLSAEDLKNIRTINKTRNVMDRDVEKGLQMGGKQSGKFQNLQADRLSKSRLKQNLRDIAFSRFLSPSRVGQIRGQAPVDLGFARNRLADELVADRNINDMRVSAIQPDGTMMALGDLLRIGGTAYGLYNLGSSLGSTAAANPYTEIWGPSFGSTAEAAAAGSAGTVAQPWYSKAWDDIGNFFSSNIDNPTTAPSRVSSIFNPNSFGGGASRGIAPSNAINRFQSSNIPSTAWGFGSSRDRFGDVSAGNWWGGRG